VLLNQSNRKRLHVVAVKSPAIHADVRRHALQDIAVITGGKAFFKDAGDSLSQVKPEDLGKARRAWADTNFFGLIGGRGDPRQVRQHIATVRAAYRNCKDTDESKRLRERLGKLIGGAAILWVGASTPLGVETRKELAESTAEAMRGALRDGVVPGGGVTLLEISQILRRQARETACLILSEALEAPFRVLLQNAGHDPSRGLAEVLLAGEGWGFDVVAGKVVRMADAGIFDSAAVIKLAVLSAIRSAALALTVDVMVHRANPPESMQTS
jgi:chaperonin GroEL